MSGGRRRLLLFFSYMGTRFSGVQKQAQAVTVQGSPFHPISQVSVTQPDSHPVGVVDNALCVLLQAPPSAIRSAVSSRTDAGVHALENTATVEVPSDANGLLGIKAPYNLHVRHTLSSLLV